MSSLANDRQLVNDDFDSMYFDGTRWVGRGGNSGAASMGGSGSNSASSNNIVTSATGAEPLEKALEKAYRAIEKIKRAADASNASLKVYAENFDKIEKSANKMSESLKIATNGAKKLNTSTKKDKDTLKDSVQGNREGASNRRYVLTDEEKRRRRDELKREQQFRKADKSMKGFLSGIADISDVSVLATAAITGTIAAIKGLNDVTEEQSKRMTEFARSMDILGKSMTSGQKALADYSELSMQFDNLKERVKEGLAEMFAGSDFKALKEFPVAAYEYFTGSDLSQESDITKANTIASITAQAKQTGMSADLAQELATKTYNAGSKLRQPGEAASDVASRLAEAWLSGGSSAADLGIVADDQTLTGYMADVWGKDISNVEITDAMKAYYRFMMVMQQGADSNTDYLQDMIGQWKTLGQQIEKTKNQLFSFDEVINLGGGYDSSMPGAYGDLFNEASDAGLSEDSDIEKKLAHASMETAVQVMNSMYDAVKEKLDDIMEITRTSMDDITEMTKTSIDEIVNNSVEAANNVSEYTLQASNELIIKAEEGIDNLLEFTETSFDKHTDILNDMLVNVADNTETLTQESIETMHGLSDEYLSTLQETNESVLSTFGEVNLEINRILDEMLATAKEKSEEVYLAMLEVANGALEATVNVEHQINESSSNITESVHNMSVNSEQALNDLSSLISKTDIEITESLSGAFNEIVAVASEAQSAIISNTDATSSSIEFIYSRAISNMDRIASQYTSMISSISNNAIASLGVEGAQQTHVTNQANKQVQAQMQETQMPNLKTSVSRSTSSNASLASGAKFSSNGSQLVMSNGSEFMGGDATAKKSASNSKSSNSTLGQATASTTSQQVVSSVGSAAATGAANLATGILDPFEIGDLLNAYTDSNGKIDWERALKEGLPSFYINSITQPIEATGRGWSGNNITGTKGLMGAIEGFLEFGAGETVGDWGGTLELLGKLANDWKMEGLGDTVSSIGDAIMYGDASLLRTTKLEKSPVSQKDDFLKYANEIGLADGRGFADGGIGTREVHNATLFEGNKKEAIIPLESEQGINYLSEAMREAGSIGDGGMGGNNINVYMTLGGINVIDDPAHLDEVAGMLADAIAIQLQRRGELNYGSSLQ